MIIGHNILKTCFLLFLGIFTFYFSHVYGSEIQYLFPIPDTEHHQPETVIILRFWNINPDQIANLNSFITLTGDISGNLTGQTVVSTDGRTINFKPDVNYSLGEKVNVRVTPRRIGQSNAFLDTTFHFTILEELPPSFPEPDPLFSSQGNESQSIRKTTVTNGPDPVILNGVSIPPDFPIINVLTSDNPDTGYVFVSKLEDNTFHIISDNEGNPVWYRRVTAGNSFDLKVQHDGQLSMTSPYEITRYLHIAMDSTYTVTDTFRTALGYWIDIHELQVMPNGDYYLINGEHRNVDMSKVVEGGDPNAYVVDNFIVGMDSEDHLIFLWRSMDHYEVTNAIHKDLTQNRIDYAHLNAIEIDHDGHILTSCRHQDEITKIDRNTGQIIWRLGGRYDEFQWINDVARISYQHDIRVLPNGHYTIFDNGNFHNPPFSRALELEVDTNNWTVTKVWEYNSGDIQSEGMGNAQRLPGGNTLINWGYIPYPFLTEVRPDGSKALEMTFRDGGRSYRTFKFPWEGKAAIPYMILVHNTDRITLLFNKFGDPDVSYYNIYAGTSPHPTQIVATTTQPFKHLITELENNQHYYFRVTAVNTIGEESDYSNEQNMLVNLTVPGENLIQNGDFESGFSSWNLNVYNGAETSVEITPDGEMHFVILNPGLNLSDIVLNQTDIPVLQGRTYQIGFDAYAEGSRLFEVSLQKDDPPWNNISLNGPSWITPQKQHFTYEFVLDDPSATEALISLKAGGSPINVYVDNVSLKQILDLSPPEANFKADTTMGMHPFEVHFQDLSFGSITSWSWDFGDGGTSTDQHPSHIYQSADTFSISLTVTGPEGSDVMIRDNYITVLESPPVADFSADTTSGFWPFTVQFSDLSTGVISTWNWSFGDGEISIEQSPSHAYQTADTFDVTLSVTGPGGADTLLRENHILVSDPPPVSDFTADTTRGLFPLDVQFSDLSSGPVFVWLWDFGDGNTSILQNPSNTYSTIDSFAVTLTVIGPGGVDVLTRPDYIVTSGLAPTAGFTADTTHGAVPLQVKFTDESIGLVDAWSWDFGDGKTSAEQHPVHQYTTVDTFTVNLIASGQSGADTLVRPDYITVLEPPPVADFTADTTEGATPFEVQFTDQSSGMVLSWLWDFGDGNTSTNQNPSHLFQDADTFDVTLTVAGPGGEDTKTRTAYIITSDPSGVDNQNNRIPAEFALLQNYPNPFNASTTINYAVPEPSEIRLAVYNVRGECVCELVNGPHGPGVYQAHLDASELGSGLYFYRMESNAMKDNAVLIRKMILLK